MRIFIYIAALMVLAFFLIYISAYFRRFLDKYGLRSQPRVQRRFFKKSGKKGSFTK